MGGTLLTPQYGGQTREPWILDQGSRESCTGHAVAQSIYALTGAKHSPDHAWVNGLLRDGWKPDELPNIGVRLSSVVAGMRLHGACRADMWGPGSLGFESPAVPPTAMRIDAQRVRLDAYPIYGNGQAMLDQIIDAMARQYPVGIVVRADTAFRRARWEAVPKSSEDAPLHMITGWRFERRIQGGQYLVTCVNSWGPMHGERGLVHLSEARVRECPFAFAVRGLL